MPGRSAPARAWSWGSRRGACGTRRLRACRCTPEAGARAGGLPVRVPRGVQQRRGGTSRAGRRRAAGRASAARPARAARGGAAPTAVRRAVGPDPVRRRGGPPDAVRRAAGPAAVGAPGAVPRGRRRAVRRAGRRARRGRRGGRRARGRRRARGGRRARGRRRGRRCPSGSAWRSCSARRCRSGWRPGRSPTATGRPSPVLRSPRERTASRPSPGRVPYRARSGVGRRRARRDGVLHRPRRRPAGRPSRPQRDQDEQPVIASACEELRLVATRHRPPLAAVRLPDATGRQPLRPRLPRGVITASPDGRSRGGSPVARDRVAPAVRHDRGVTDVGATIGVEEEYHLVDAETMALADAPGVVAEAVAAARRAGAGRDLDQPARGRDQRPDQPRGRARPSWCELRRAADAAAQRHGCRILPTGTHPSATWRDQTRTPDRRYDELEERFGLLALQQLITGTHVHVVVPDGELAVQVLDRLRPDLPRAAGAVGQLAVLGGRWTPATRATARSGTPASRSPARRRCCATARPTTAWSPTWSAPAWSATPRTCTGTRGSSTRFPTIEVRVADTCPRLDDVVLQAGPGPLARPHGGGGRCRRRAVPRAASRAGACRALGRGPRRPRGPSARPAHRRAPSWRPRSCGPCSSGCASDLEDAGEWDEVHALAEQALARGTSAAEQRRTVRPHRADLAEVVRQPWSATPSRPRRASAPEQVGRWARRRARRGVGDGGARRR